MNLLPESKRCTRDGCEEPRHARQLCNSHYMQHLREANDAPPQCDIDGCHRPKRRLTAGWCNAHYQRFLQFGTPMADIPIRGRQPRSQQGCTVDGCQRDHYAKGLCNTHYVRKRYHDNRPDDVIPTRLTITAADLDQLPDVDPDDTSWQDQAACRDTGPDMWFPEPSDRDAAGRAIDVCRTCPVQPQCLSAALDTPPASDFGIWGGTSARQRRDLRQARQARRQQATA